LPRVLLVNNFYTRKSMQELKSAIAVQGAAVTVADKREVSARLFNSFDGVVLSGSRAMLSDRATRTKYSSETEAAVDTSTHVLGICFGHQLLGAAFGSRVQKTERPTRKYVRTRVLDQSGLFAGLSETISVFESHYEVVETTPRPFKLLAESESSRVSAMKHRNRPIWGIQFHPERNSERNPDGRTILRNFIGQLR